MISNGTVWQVTMAPYPSANPSGLGLRPLFEDLSRFLVPEQKVEVYVLIFADGKNPGLCANPKFSFQFAKMNRSRGVVRR